MKYRLRGQLLSRGLSRFLVKNLLNLNTLLTHELRLDQSFGQSKWTFRGKKEPQYWVTVPVKYNPKTAFRNGEHARFKSSFRALE